MANNKILIMVGLFAAVGLFTIPLFSGNVDTDKPLAMIYKSPTCGCCVGYAGYLERQGFDVKTIMTEDMTSIKETHDIPKNMESCHTVVIDDYFIEGHIPIEAVNTMLAEAPNIDGIALPGMPSGSPGMPGIKNTKFTIYGLSDGKTSIYKVI